MVQKSSKNQEIVFPDESHFVIREILKKHKLYREPKEIMAELAKEMRKTQTFKKKEEIADKQPESRLAKLIKNVAEEKIMLGDFQEELRQIFNISPKIAKDLAIDLEKNVLVFARKITIEEEVVPPTRKRIPIKPLPVVPPLEEPEEPLETPSQPGLKAVPPEVEKPAPPEKKPIPQKEDVYREPFE